MVTPLSAVVVPLPRSRPTPEVAPPSVGAKNEGGAVFFHGEIRSGSQRGAAGETRPLRTGADAETIDSLVELARSASGMMEVALLGKKRLIDASQFTPRGHYQNGSLKQCFQAMMWLGRIDMRLP